MKRSESYNTKQKEIILDVIKKKKKEFTVKEIYAELENKIGLTTIYRLIDKLTEEGLLNKTIGKNNTTYYTYLEKCSKKNHFYLKCESCGNMMHVDCDCIVELSNHILKKHKFKTCDNHIIINGLCDHCTKD